MERRKRPFRILITLRSWCRYIYRIFLGNHGSSPVLPPPPSCLPSFPSPRPWRRPRRRLARQRPPSQARGSASSSPKNRTIFLTSFFGGYNVYLVEYAIDAQISRVWQRPPLAGGRLHEEGCASHLNLIDKFIKSKNNCKVMLPARIPTRGRTQSSASLSS